MRYLALACDYDGTIASGGRVDPRTVEALARVKASGRRLLLVTGRELEDLRRVFPEWAMFDRIVAENGAVLHAPATREQRLLGEPPPGQFVTALASRGCRRSSVATSSLPRRARTRPPSCAPSATSPSNGRSSSTRGR